MASSSGQASAAAKEKARWDTITMDGAASRATVASLKAVLVQLPVGADGHPNFLCAMEQLEAREDWQALVEEFGGPVQAWSRLKRAIALV